VRFTFAMIACRLSPWLRRVFPRIVSLNLSKLFFLLNVFDLPIVPPPTTPRCPWFDLFQSRADHLRPW
jgi:hypothetical protein